MTEPTYAFIDTETTSLHPETGQIWELAVVLRGPDNPEDEAVWQLPVDLSDADPFSLTIGGFWDRRWPTAQTDRDETAAVHGIRAPDVRPHMVPYHLMDDWCWHIARLLRDVVLVGNVVSFDDERLARLLRRHEAMPTWNYHIVDVETFAAGRLGWKPPWNSRQVSEALGVPVPEDQHSALADAKWARDLWDAANTPKGPQS